MSISDTTTGLYNQRAACMPGPKCKQKLSGRLQRLQKGLDLTSASHKNGIMKDIKVKKDIPFSNHNAFDWSDDGKLAFAAGEHASIVYLKKLDSLEPSFKSENVQVLRTKPLPHPLAVSAIGPDDMISAGSYFADNDALSVYWSPAGYSREGYSYLTILTSDFNCMIYEESNELVGTSFSPVVNVMKQLLYEYIDPSEETVPLATFQRLRAHSFAWGKPLDDLRLFAIGTESGEILIFNIDGNSSAHKIFVKDVVPSEEDVKSVIELAWSKWEQIGDKHQSTISYVLSDNSVRSITISFSEADDKLECKGENQLLEGPSKSKVQQFKVINSTEYGPVIVVVFASEMKAYIPNFNRSFLSKLPKYGEFHVLLKDQKGFVEIILLDSIIDAVQGGVKDDWLLKLQLTKESGLSLTTGQESNPEIHNFISQKLSFNEIGSEYFKVFGIREGKLKDTIAIHYHLYNPNSIQQKPASEFVSLLNFITTTSEKKEVKIKDIISINDWNLLSTRPLNFLLEKSVLKLKYFKKTRYDNVLIAEQYETLIKDLISSTENHAIDDTSSIDFEILLKKNLIQKFSKPEIKTLQLFQVLLKKPSPPEYTIFEMPSEELKKENQLRYELSSSIYKELYPKIIETLLENLSGLILAHIEHYKVSLDNVYDKAIYNSMYMVRKKLHGISAPAIEKTSVVKFNLYGGLYTLEFDFDFKNNSNFAFIASTNGLEWQRCSFTLLPLFYPNVRKCEICKRTYLAPDTTPLAFEEEALLDNKTLTNGSKLLNFFWNNIRGCIYCGGWLVAQRE